MRLAWHEAFEDWGSSGSAKCEERGETRSHGATGSYYRNNTVEEASQHTASTATKEVAGEIGGITYITAFFNDTAVAERCKTGARNSRQPFLVCWKASEQPSAGESVE